MQPISYKFNLISEIAYEYSIPSSIKIQLFDCNLKSQSQNRVIVVLEISEEKAVFNFSRALSIQEFKELISSVKRAETELGIKLMSAFLKEINNESNPQAISKICIKEKIRIGDEEALFLAVEKGYFKLIKKFVSKNKELLNPFPNNRSLIGHALFKNQLEIANYLLSAGAEFSPQELKNFASVDNFGFIIGCNNPENSLKIEDLAYPFIDYIVGKLSEEDCDKFQSDLLIFAICLDDIRLLKYNLNKLSPNKKAKWLNETANKTTYIISIDLLDLLINEGASAGCFFYLLGCNKRFEIMHHLLDQGISVDILNEHKFTALDVAAKHNIMETVSFLLKNGANPVSFGRPSSYYSSSHECKNLLIQNEPRGLSDYYFHLLMFAHAFQINIKSEDPIFINKEFDGVRALFMPSDKDDFQITNKWTPCLYPLISLPVEVFLKNVDCPVISEIEHQFSLTSNELSELYHKNKWVFIYSHWNTHCTYIGIKGNYFFHCNTGSKSEDKFTGITFYHISDPFSVTPHLLEKLRLGDREFIEHGVVKELNLELLEVSHSKGQKGGFCALRSLLLLFKGTMILEHMPKNCDKKNFIQHFEAVSQSIQASYQKGKVAVMDRLLLDLLSLYQSEDFSFKPEIPMLLMTLAKLPEESTQWTPLLQFLKEKKAEIGMKCNGKNIFHYLKGKKNLDALRELFGSDALKAKLPQLLDETSEKQPDTPLIESIVEGRIKAVKLLLKLGANPLKEIKGRKTPLELAIALERPDFFSLLISFIEPSKQAKIVDDLLLSAIASNDIKSILTLIKAGVNLNHAHEEYGFALSQAVVFNKIEIANILLLNGANPLQSTEKVMSPLNFSILMARYEYTELMLNFIKEKSFVVQSLFEQALRLKKKDMVIWSLRLGANPNQHDPSGFFPLNHACYFDNESLEVVKLLLNAGANPLNWGINGTANTYPAIQEAAMLGSCELLEAMFHSFDKNLRSNIAKQLLATTSLAPPILELVTKNALQEEGSICQLKPLPSEHKVSL